MSVSKKDGIGAKQIGSKKIERGLGEEKTVCVRERVSE